MTFFENRAESYRKFASQCQKYNEIPLDNYAKNAVKRGLRDVDGKGVLAGLTTISTIYPQQTTAGTKMSAGGKLCYRGIDINQLVAGFVKEARYGYEEVAYLLLFGELPDQTELQEFQQLLQNKRTLPTNFVRDVIMKAPSEDLMNNLSRSLLTLACYDPKVADTSLENVLAQSLQIISVFPLLAVYAYHAYAHANGASMYIHRPDPKLSCAEAILTMLRPDKNYTRQEAQTLDMALVLHMEHGGGNNSTFTTRVVTSSGTDTYAAIVAALSSLKGPKHGGANIKVTQMMKDLQENVTDLKDESQVRRYLEAVLAKEAFDKKGLIYGMGHAVYSDHDPRAQILKKYVAKLAAEKGPARQAEFELYQLVERVAPEIIAEKRRIYKGVSANIDFFSGLMYGMLALPEELYTPMFASARVVGWSAHRLEELINSDKIIRPAYLEITPDQEYLPLNKRFHG